MFKKICAVINSGYFIAFSERLGKCRGQCQESGVSKGVSDQSSYTSSLRNMSGWKVVGISGATCGGKTTLSNFLRENFKGSVLLLQDDYFYDKDSEHHLIIPELNHANWERLESIDWDALMKRVKEILATTPPYKESLFIIEGHIIYNYSPLEKLFNEKFFLTLTKEECYKRRSGRVYDPVDPPGYFEICVWPMYLSNKQELEEKCENIKFLDGTAEKEKIFNQVLCELKKNINIL